MNFTITKDEGLYKNIYFDRHIVRYNLGDTPLQCYIELYHTVEERRRSIILIILLTDTSKFFTI